MSLVTGWRSVTVTAACLVAGFAITGVTRLAARELETKTGAQWFPYHQWTIVNPSWDGNPFDVPASVEFTSLVNGEKRRTEMFYRGGETWAFRFTGTQLGRWSFSTTSADNDLDGHTGEVVVIPSPRKNAQGFLKNYDNKWGWEGTQMAFVPQLVMWDYIAGGNSPTIFYNHPELVDAKIDEFLDKHGFNGFHLPVIGGRWFDLDATSDRVEQEMTDPDPRTFEALELLITKTHETGGLVHIWSWGDHQRSQTPRSLAGGIGGEVDRRLQRYIAARLGPIPGWSMGYGFDLDEWVKARQLRTWRDTMHRHMGWHHFLGGRPAGPNQGIDHAADARWNQGLDFSSYEHHRPTYEVYQAALRATPGQPVFSEDRFRIRTGGYPEKDYSAELTRRGLYHSTMAGGIANIWGIDPELSRGGVYPNRDQIKTYTVFFHDRRRFLPDMAPADQLSEDTDTRVLVSAGARSLVLYREAHGGIQVDLRGMENPLPGVAIDTKKAYQEVELGNLPPEAQMIRLPAISDWVVAIGHFGHNAVVNP